MRSKTKICVRSSIDGHPFSRKGRRKRIVASFKVVYRGVGHSPRDEETLLSVEGTYNWLCATLTPVPEDCTNVKEFFKALLQELSDVFSVLFIQKFAFLMFAGSN